MVMALTGGGREVSLRPVHRVQCEQGLRRVTCSDGSHSRGREVSLRPVHRVSVNKA